MPVDILLDKKRLTLRTHASGFVTLADFIDCMEKILQLIDSGAINASWGQIIDLTDVSSVVELTESDVTMIASQNHWSPDSKRAIVVTEDRAQELARFYQTLGSKMGQQIKLVDSIEEAEMWVISP